MVEPTPPSAAVSEAEHLDDIVKSGSKLARDLSERTRAFIDRPVEGLSIEQIDADITAAGKLIAELQTSLERLEFEREGLQKMSSELSAAAPHPDVDTWGTPWNLFMARLNNINKALSDVAAQQNRLRQRIQGHIDTLNKLYAERAELPMGLLPTRGGPRAAEEEPLPAALLPFAKTEAKAVPRRMAGLRRLQEEQARLWLPKTLEEERIEKEGFTTALGYVEGRKEEVAVVRAKPGDVCPICHDGEIYETGRTITLEGVEEAELDCTNPECPTKRLPKE